jgi:hypothetical protein
MFDLDRRMLAVVGRVWWEPLPVGEAVIIAQLQIA